MTRVGNAPIASAFRGEGSEAFTNLSSRKTDPAVRVPVNTTTQPRLHLARYFGEGER